MITSQFNAEVKATADRDGETWTLAELNILVLCQTEADFIDCAAVFGRTPFACREMFYKARRDGVILATGKRRCTTVYRGWMEGDSE